jgi:hypothetical protein
VKSSTEPSSARRLSFLSFSRPPSIPALEEAVEEVGFIDELRVDGVELYSPELVGVAEPDAIEE